MGAHVGSPEVVFRPGRPVAGDWSFDVGTAGSLTLLLQAALPALLASPGRSRLRLRGGTDVPFSPTWAWFQEVYAHRVGPLADRLDVTVHRRGFAPRGGGEVEVVVENPEEPWDLEAFRRRVRSRLGGDASRWRATRGAVVHSVAEAGLRGVARRQAEGAVAAFEAAGVAAVAVQEDVGADGPGSACCAVLEDAAGARLGGDRLGRPGFPADRVGAGAAGDVLEDVAAGASVDRHLADHWVPWVALGAGAVRAPRATGHLVTNVAVTASFLGPESVVLEGLVVRRG